MDWCFNWSKRPISWHFSLFKMKAFLHTMLIVSITIFFCWNIWVPLQQILYPQVSDCSLNWYPVYISQPDGGTVVPKFGEWDETKPETGDNFTGIFKKLQEEKHNGLGKSPGHVIPPSSSYPTKRNLNSDDSAKVCMLNNLLSSFLFFTASVKPLYLCLFFHINLGFLLVHFLLSFFQCPCFPWCRKWGACFCAHDSLYP